MVEQGIDQGAAIARVFAQAGAGVDHHPGRLVDDREVRVFIDDIERDGLGDGAQRRRLGIGQDGDSLAAAQLVRRLLRLAVDLDAALRQQQLHPRAADVGKRLRQEDVKALAASLGRRFQDVAGP